VSDPLVGVTLPQFTAEAETLVGGAERAEALGLDSVWVFDHLWPLSGGKARPIFEAWTSVSWLAAATKRVGIGTLVTRSSLRHPALLAKMAATLAEIAPGRLTIAVGSGDEKSRAENEAFGIPYYAEDERIEQFASTVRVLTSFFEQPEITNSGRRTKIEHLPVSPRPRVRPAVWVAGRSDDALEIAGTYADGWNGWGGTPERWAQDALRATEFAGAAGDRPLELTWGGLAVIGPDADTARSKLGKRDPSQYVVGGPEEIARHLGALIEAGARHVILTFSDAAEPTSYELLATRVKPLLGLA
jgi:alkanesulfonate monooxygenase SsuD/methylene tetrahydromethanopterin reductase-like flavin-dependent oxidoreductase (luciferase family)